MAVLGWEKSKSSDHQQIEESSGAILKLVGMFW
jgi:hypothetical protein